MNGLAVVLRLAEGLEVAPGYEKTLHELVQGLTNMLNAFEKDEDD